MDRHHTVDTTWHEIQYDHERDVAMQDEYGVQFLTYWFDEGRNTTFCLVSAPSAETIAEIHAAAHGSIPNDVVEVDQATVMSFMGRVADIPAGDQIEGRPVDRAFRAIMFTDLVEYTALTGRLGDHAAIGLLRQHNDVVREALRKFGGREVKHTGDGFMASFRTADNALRCAVKIQRGVEALPGLDLAGKLQVRIGLSAGEPIEEGEDLFGTSVNLASRLCDAATPGDIYVSKEFVEALDQSADSIEQIGAMRLKGFESEQYVGKAILTKE